MSVTTENRGDAGNKTTSCLSGRTLATVCQQWPVFGPERSTSGAFGPNQDNIGGRVWPRSVRSMLVKLKIALLLQVLQVGDPGVLPTPIMEPNPAHVFQSGHGSCRDMQR